MCLASTVRPFRSPVDFCPSIWAVGALDSHRATSVPRRVVAVFLIADNGPGDTVSRQLVCANRFHAPSLSYVRTESMTMHVDFLFDTPFSNHLFTLTHTTSRKF